MKITAMILFLVFSPAAASALDWTSDPVPQLEALRAALPPVAMPAPAPTTTTAQAEEIFECRPEIIEAFKEAWLMAGSGRREYEAAFIVNRVDAGYEIEFMPMTHEAYQLPVRYSPTDTVAIVHTHPNAVYQTPGPGDYAAKVPNYVISRTALYVTIPGTQKHRFVRRAWAKPCA